MTYVSSDFFVENCIAFVGGNIEIDNSNFRGNKSCQNRLLNFNGLDKYKLSIKNSYFNGEYQCPFLNLDNGLKVNIEKSTFEKAYSNEFIGGGGVIRAFYSNIYIENCIFKDNISMEEGGAFFLDNLLDFKANKLEIYNNTSMHIGSVAYIRTSEEINSVAKFTNIKQYDTGNMSGMRLGGLIMNLEKSANVIIENYYAENLINPDSAGCAFIVSDYVRLTIRNMEINKIRGRNIDGLFLFTYKGSDIVFNVYNVTLNDLYQYNARETASFIWLEDGSSGNIEK
ncbi:hypothetical protein PIROE2DRAFT_65292 [Piromyces sp. E2]|nr:hypothetical protein PIROE2DRAFT_65292 [Piromyces sp. E2]|eukprot:OUM56931.1 hypothetical protein PIROE2DRAFT_65292 [Piromyces sp. E2]